MLSVKFYEESPVRKYLDKVIGVDSTPLANSAEALAELEHYPRLKFRVMLSSVPVSVVSSTELCEVARVVPTDAEKNVVVGAATHSDNGEVGIILQLPINRATDQELVDMWNHEMTHVEQYRDGRLTVNGQTVVWEGEVFEAICIPQDMPVTHEDLARFAIQVARYMSQPWEIEAYRHNDVDRTLPDATKLMERLGAYWDPSWDEEVVYNRLVNQLTLGNSPTIYSVMFE